ncbi:neprilysin-like [Ornithodoros turicata]|uniref:neprilysin-like n=1 Tax=Ornithodoros turicata TaxID=34597 RepID=UPI003139A9E2
MNGSSRYGQRRGVAVPYRTLGYGCGSEESEIDGRTWSSWRSGPAGYGYPVSTAYTRSSEQQTRAPSARLPEEHLEYYSTIDGIELPTQPTVTQMWAQQQYDAPMSPHADEYYKSVATSEFSANSSFTYPHKEEVDNTAGGNTGESQATETTEAEKSGSASNNCLGSPGGSSMSLGSVDETRRKSSLTWVLGLLALAALLAGCGYLLYANGYIPSDFYKLVSVPSGVRSSTHAQVGTKSVTRKLVPPVTGGYFNDAPDRGNFVDDTTDTTSSYIAVSLSSAGQGRPVTPLNKRKKVAVWEGKRIYAKSVSVTKARRSVPPSVSSTASAAKMTKYSLTTVVQQPTKQVKNDSTKVTRSGTRKDSGYNEGKQCETRACEKESIYLTNYLDWNIKPCMDFYGFVCNNWRKLHPEVGESIDSLLVRRVEEEIYHMFTAQRKTPSRLLKTEALISTCVQKPFSNDHRSTLLDFMRDLGLRGWPFLDDTKTLIDVWKSVSLLLRNLDLATLVSVSVEMDPENDDKHIIALGEPSLLIGTYRTKTVPLPEWYNMVITTCFKIFTSGKYVEIAKKVRDIAVRLAEISVDRGLEPFSAKRYKLAQLKRYGNLLQLLTFVFNNITVVHSRMKVLIKSPDYLGSLKDVMHVTKSADMLNYLGFRALVCISPLLPDQALDMASLQMKELTGIDQKNWPRWRRCIRMFERVVPVVFLHAYAQTREGVSNKDKVWALMHEIQASFMLSMNSAPWMSIEDKVMLKDKLTKIRLEMFYKFWGKLVHKHSAAEFLPDVEPGSIIVMYKSLAKQFVETKLSAIKYPRNAHVREWKGSVFDTEPYFDRQTETIFIPMTMFDPSYTIDGESMLLQLPRIVRKVFQSLMQGIHESSYALNKLRWSVDTQMGYRDMQRCIENNDDNSTDDKVLNKVTAEFDTLDSLVLLPTFKLFLKKVNHINIEDSGVLTGSNLTVKQLFFVLYAKGFCETSSEARIKEVSEEFARSPGRLRVNVPLRHSFRFPTFWECATDSPMNPNQKCTIWTS